MSKKIAHITTVHNRYDNRIFFKQVNSLRQNEFNVDLIVCDEYQSELQYNGEIISLSYPTFLNTRLMKLLSVLYFLLSNRKKYKIYHFHDPELLPVALLLKLTRSEVVFDCHESFIEAISTKDLSKVKMFFVINFLKILKKLSYKYLNVIFAEKSYYTPEAIQNEIVLNYPIIDTLENYSNFQRQLKKPIKFLYVGDVTKIRGAVKMCEMVKMLNDEGIKCTLDLVGTVRECVDITPWKDYISFHGFKEIDEAYAFSREAHFGLIFLENLPNYSQSYPTKLFEYISVGLPYLAIQTPAIDELHRKIQCGCVLHSEEVSELVVEIKSILTDENLYSSWVLRCKTIRHRYNWSTQFERLLQLPAYKKLLGVK